MHLKLLSWPHDPRQAKRKLLTCDKYAICGHPAYPGLCSPFTYSVVSNASVSRNWRPDQIARVRRLTWALSVRTCLKTRFRMAQRYIYIYIYIYMWTIINLQRLKIIQGKVNRSCPTNNDHPQTMPVWKSVLGQKTTTCSYVAND